MSPHISNIYSLHGFFFKILLFRFQIKSVLRMWVYFKTITWDVREVNHHFSQGTWTGYVLSYVSPPPYPLSWFGEKSLCYMERQNLPCYMEKLNLLQGVVKQSKRGNSALACKIIEDIPFCMRLLPEFCRSNSFLFIFVIIFPQARQ